MNNDSAEGRKIPITEDRIHSNPRPEGENDELTAAIYARTSSPGQRFGYSIDEQVRRCWKQCEKAEWEVKYVFSDEAESGRSTDRPKFQTMMEKAENGEIDVVVFWKLDRFCRSLVDLVKTEEQLNEWDVALHSITEYIDTTSPVGRFNFRNLASAAELETDLTSQRVKMGMFGMAQEGKWPNDMPPLGYEKDADGTLSVCVAEKETVERICRLYLQEKSMPQVAFLLNESGIKTKQGEDWCRQSVRTVLSNELYIGIYQVAGFEKYIEEYQILSDELFEAVTETRYRFRNKSQKMDPSRKKSKARRICSQYQQSLEVE